MEMPSPSLPKPILVFVEAFDARAGKAAATTKPGLMLLKSPGELFKFEHRPEDVQM